ncbi:prepilin-type N-terminal cleavage/methylation domain-containing protein [bacterium]|nr:prepilin-type N-terminal cleavage/methylation domain-containing protein [bacterium]
MRKPSRTGFSLVEVILACALMSILMVVLGEALSQAQNAFRNVTGTSDAADELRKVCQHVRQELIQTSGVQIGSRDSANSLGSPDGEAIWFLSNIGSDGNPHFMSDGSPFWQRNVLYYIVVPGNHLGLFGWNCAGGADPDGYDDRCPHKVLIRKEIDFGVATDFVNEATVETLMSSGDILPYLTQPVGYSCSAMNAEAGMRQVRIVGRSLLTFRVSSAAPGSVTLDTRAVSIARARTKVALGTASMVDSPFTFHFGITVTPSVP